MPCKKLQKTLILSAARQLRDTFLSEPRTPLHKSSALHELEGMLTVIGYVFGTESDVYKAVDAAWHEINAAQPTEEVKP
jgi:hypothetical protein